MELVPHPSSLPVDLTLYEQITPMLKTALGVYFNTDYYVASRKTIAREEVQYVFY